jgi:YbbR domain-containing protein
MRRRLLQALRRNLLLKVISLGLAVLLYVVVHSEKQSLVQGAVGVSYSPPAGKALAVKPPASLLVGVAGPVSRLQRFRIEDVPAVSIDLSGEKEGYFKFRDELLSLPVGLRVAFIRPDGFTVRFEPPLQRRLSVRLMVQGEPAAGFQVVGRKVRPSRAMINGPRSEVQAISELQTEAVNIDGANTTQLRTVRLATLPPGVRVEGARLFEVTVEIGARKEK